MSNRRKTADARIKQMLQNSQEAGEKDGQPVVFITKPAQHRRAQKREADLRDRRVDALYYNMMKGQ